MKPGERIREFRKNKGFTQKEFAEKMVYSQVFLSAIEIGKVEPSREFLKKLNEVFGISSDYILYGGPSNQAGVEISSHIIYSEPKKESIIIHDPDSKYTILPTATKKLLDNVLEILESENDPIINPLKAHIKASLEAVCCKKNDKDKSKGGG